MPAPLRWFLLVSLGAAACLPDAPALDEHDVSDLGWVKF